MYIFDSWFNNFKTTSQYTSGAISFQKKLKFWSAPVNSAFVKFGFDDSVSCVLFIYPSLWKTHVCNDGINVTYMFITVGLNLILASLRHHFSLLYYAFLARNNWCGSYTRNARMAHTLNSIRFKNCVSSSVEIPFCIWICPILVNLLLSFKLLQAGTGNRIFSGDDTDPHYGNEDGDKMVTLTLGNSRVVRPRPFFVTDQCKLRSNWKMAECPHMFGKVSHEMAS